MSFVLYNQAAYSYEIADTGELKPCQLIDTSNIPPQRLQDLEYRFWQQSQLLKPANYDSFAIAKSTVNLLASDREANRYKRGGYKQ